VTISRLDCQSIGEINHGIGVPSTASQMAHLLAWLMERVRSFMARFASLDAFVAAGRFLRGVSSPLRIDQNPSRMDRCKLTHTKPKTPVIWMPL